jgi:hypothetical protein
VTADDGRLAALAAAFAPSRATVLLGRLAAPAPPELAPECARLAAAPRRERLLALAAALRGGAEVPRSLAEALAKQERPRIAALLSRLAAGAPPGDVAPALVRLCRERPWR